MLARSLIGTAKGVPYGRMRMLARSLIGTAEGVPYQWKPFGGRVTQWGDQKLCSARATWRSFGKKADIVIHLDGTICNRPATVFMAVHGILL